MKKHSRLTAADTSPATASTSLDDRFITDIRGIISTCRAQAIRSVDFQRVIMYWQLGERIVKEEQGGKERADYGAYLLRNLAKTLEPEYGSGFSVRQLERARQFFLLFPIASALRTQFNWMQYTNCSSPFPTATSANTTNWRRRTTTGMDANSNGKSTPCFMSAF